MEIEMTRTQDPRESKLQDIIARGKASLSVSLEEIQQEFANRQDIMVKPSAIDFVLDDHTIRPVIRDHAYHLTAHSQGQVLQRAGIPSQFATRLMDLEENDLLRENLKRLTERTQDDGIQIRRVGETIKGWLSPAYKRMDAAQAVDR